MPAFVSNIAPCITQVPFNLVHYALLINQLRFRLTFFKVLANFPTDKYGLDCGLELIAKVFQLRLNNISGVLVLEGYDYSSRIIPRTGSSLGCASGCDAGGCEFETPTGPTLRVFK